MSNEQKKLVPPDLARRNFLECTACAAAGGFAAMLPRAVRATQANVKTSTPGTCPDVAIPMKDVEGKIAFITGGSSGIGLGIARAFTEAGMKVAISYRTKSHHDEAMQQLANARHQVYAVRVDVTDRRGMENAAGEVVRTFGKVHVVVNNAGVSLPPTLSSTSYEDWDWLLNVNINSVFNGVRSFLPHIRAHGEGGQIISTSSALGLVALSSGGAYTVSKYAVIGLMEALRAELATTNVGTSVFCPGLVTSKILESSFRDRPEGGADKSDADLLKKDRQFRNDPEFAMDPLEAGRLVLRGMRNNDLYILTHPEYAQIMQDRSDALMASIPRDIHPTEKRLARARAMFSSSIYTVERDRRLCAPAVRSKEE